MTPRIVLRIEKDGEAIDKLQLTGKCFHTFGTLPSNDFKLEHKSISRSHCCIFTDSSSKVIVIDLGSSAGTFVNSVKLEQFHPHPLSAADVIIMGMSTRKYVVLIDRKELEEYAEARASQLKK
jgi:pSer/pThr/pTyr-binding forkhead associated (FHA) protein